MPLSKPSTNVVKTRFLIISDTHGMEFNSENKPIQKADVAIHCGDLTEGSQLEEFRAGVRLLTGLDAPLKLVIAGNHDFTVDTPKFKKKVADIRQPLEAGDVEKAYGAYGEARELFEEAKAAGVVFLDEGTHKFVLKNGALLNVYASPWTPSLGDWGFSYNPTTGHDFQIPHGIDIAITHGPPKGIMDYTDSKQRVGCQSLFNSIARARPRLHCFGHIHEGWGAKLVTWRDLDAETTPTHFTAIDHGNSVVVEKLTGLMQTKLDMPEIVEEKLKKAESYRQKRCCSTSHCTGDANPLDYGAQTLFVNAAIEGTEENPMQLPWLVDLELPWTNGLKSENVKGYSQTDTTEEQAAKLKTSIMNDTRNEITKNDQCSESLRMARRWKPY